MKYTPRPWTQGIHGHLPFAQSITMVYQGDMPIAEVIRQPLSPLEEAEANAKLISAAPDLLEALKELDDIADRSWGSGDDTTSKQRWDVLAKSARAIAKAEA